VLTKRYAKNVHRFGAGGLGNANRWYEIEGREKPLAEREGANSLKNGNALVKRYERRGTLDAEIERRVAKKKKKTRGDAPCRRA